MEKEKLTAEIGELKADLEMALEKWRIAQGTAMERGKRIKELEEILDACEAANAKHLARIDHLESVYWKHWREREELRRLCRDLWADHVDLCEWQAQCQTNDELEKRMEQLGLLDGEQ